MEKKDIVLKEFEQVNKDLKRIKGLKNQPQAVLIYTSMLDLLRLSMKKGDLYKNSKGYFVIYTPEKAEDEWGIKRTKFNESKKLLKELGLINYDQQVAKKAGVSTPIYVTVEISHLCDYELKTDIAPKMTGDVVTIENTINDNTLTVEQKPTTIETNVNSNDLAKIFEMLKEIKAENADLKERITSLENKETIINAPVDIVANQETVEIETSIETINEPTIETTHEEMVVIEKVKEPAKMAFGQNTFSFNKSEEKVEMSEITEEKVEINKIEEIKSKLPQLTEEEENNIRKAIEFDKLLEEKPVQSKNIYIAPKNIGFIPSVNDVI